MIVDDEVANNRGSSEASLPDMIIGFECEQCGYTSISDKELKQHIRMKHRISQIDGVDDIDPEVNNKIKENQDNKNKGDNEANDQIDCLNLRLCGSLVSVNKAMLYSGHSNHTRLTR